MASCKKDVISQADGDTSAPITPNNRQLPQLIASPNQNSQASSTESGYASMSEGTNSTPNRRRTSSYCSSFERPRTLFTSTEQGGSGMVNSTPETTPITTSRRSQLVPGARDFVIPLNGQLVTPASTPVTPTQNSNVPISRQFSAP